MDVAVRPTRAARFLVFERIIDAAAPRGSERCPKVTHRMASALTDSGRLAMLTRLTIPGVATVEQERFAFLKARCGQCPHRCMTPLD